MWYQTWEGSKVTRLALILRIHQSKLVRKGKPQALAPNSGLPRLAFLLTVATKRCSAGETGSDVNGFAFLLGHML